MEEGPYVDSRICDVNLENAYAMLNNVFFAPRRRCNLHIVKQARLQCVSRRLCFLGTKLAIYARRWLRDHDEELQQAIAGSNFLSRSQHRVSLQVKKIEPMKQ